jgi:cytochrome P450
MRVLTSGTSPQTHKEIHDKYGPVVRISPNQLSFCSASSWKDIYGHVGGRQQFLKSDTYQNEYHPNIVSARDPAQHGQMRKLLSHGFSQKALMEQEDIVHEYVDLLIKQIQTHATNKPQGEEMVKWYNYITFDIIGDLAFGDPFGSLKSGMFILSEYQLAKFNTNIFHS